MNLDLPLDLDLIIPDPAPTLDEQFAAFHAANPWVADALERLTDDYLMTGHRRVGMKMLVEVLRWQYDRQTTGDPFKVNNNYTSRYARLLVSRRPEWGDVFQTRELRSAS